MNLVKTTKKYYIYELSEKEVNESGRCKYLVFSNSVFGYKVIDFDTLDEAISFSHHL